MLKLFVVLTNISLPPPYNIHNNALNVIIVLCCCKCNYYKQVKC